MTEAGGWVWRRLKIWAARLAAGSRSGPGGLSIAARLDLGPKKSLLVVAYGERRFLVANGAETISAAIEIGAGRDRPRSRRALPRPISGRAGGRRTRRLRGESSTPPAPAERARAGR